MVENVIVFSHQRIAKEKVLFSSLFLDLHLTTMTVKQVASFHGPLKRENIGVKTTEQ